VADGDGVTDMAENPYLCETSRLNEVLCEGTWDVTAEGIERFRSLMGYPPTPAGDTSTAPTSMGLAYGLRLGWENSIFPPGAVRMGDEDTFGVPARAGDRLVTRLRIVDKFEKRGRKFMKYEMVTRNQAEELVCSVVFTAITP
jgi:hypothetical protein